MYTVYVNHPTRIATVHRSHCGYIRMHGGVSGREPPTGYYVDDIATREVAERVAKGTGYKVRFCQPYN